VLSSASSVATEREVEPTGDDKSGPEEAVKGTVEGVKGKAKEVGGAVLGRDDLHREGQAQQDKADAQRDAGKKEAEAESARAGADAGVEIIGVTDQLPSADDIERVLVAVRSDRHDG
jgi:uncharacterized protein YjbJ (UPF0337 family)